MTNEEKKKKDLDETKERLAEVKEPKVNIQVASPNIYKRLQKVRHELTKLSLKKTGENTHTKYKYYELGDFLPAISRLSDENGIMSLFTLQAEKGVLRVFNVDNPIDVVTFYIPVAEAKVPTGTPIQNLGAQITYLERYLYMIAFEIAENDIQEQQKQDEKTNEKEIDQIAVDQLNEVASLENLVAVCKKLKAELGKEYQASLVSHYTRRKKEIEASKK